MRVYVPAHGRFTGPDMKIDPLDPNGACNYLFCRKNPLVYSDPWGLDYIKVGENKNVWWYAEKDQFFSSADIWPIGEVEDGSVKLREQWGGGSIPMDKLRDIAEGRFTGDERRTKAQRLLIRNAIRYGNDEEGALDIIEAGLWGTTANLAAASSWVYPGLENWWDKNIDYPGPRPITKTPEYIRAQGVYRIGTGMAETGGTSYTISQKGYATPAEAVIFKHGLSNIGFGTAQVIHGEKYFADNVYETILPIPMEPIIED